MSAPSIIDGDNAKRTHHPEQPHKPEQRAWLLGRYIARNNRIPDSIRSFLTTTRVTPTQSATSKNTSAEIGHTSNLEQLVFELLPASVESMELDRPWIAMRNDVAHGIKHSLHWMYHSAGMLPAAVRQCLCLKTLIPLYLATGKQPFDRVVHNTIVVVRDYCTLLELNRLASDEQFHHWLADSSRVAKDPSISIQQSFQVGLPTVSQSFWNHVATNQIESEVSFRHQPPRDVDHQAWWSLTHQLTRGHSHVSVPAEIAVGVVNWDRVKDHWTRVLSALNGAAKPTSDVRSQSIANTSNQADGNQAVVNTNTSAQEVVTNPVANEVEPDVNVITDEDYAYVADRLIEIRSSRDPELSANLDQLLMECRKEQSSLSLIVVKKLNSDGTQVQHSADNLLPVQPWHSQFIRALDSVAQSPNVRVFVTEEGELSLVFQDCERTELSSWIREVFGQLNNQAAVSQMVRAKPETLVAGVSTVCGPSKSFRIEQLIQAAWRCLDSASIQGVGAVKTIEVF